MELEDLRYFVAAYEAADLVESSPQGMRLIASESVHRLEALLGRALFEQRDGRAYPTRAGEELYAYAKQMLGAAECTGQTTIPAP